MKIDPSRNKQAKAVNKQSVLDKQTMGMQAGSTKKNIVPSACKYQQRALLAWYFEYPQL